METATTTYKEYNEFITAAIRWQHENKERKSKLSYALEKVLKVNKSLTEDCQVVLDEINIDCAASKDGLLVTDEQGRFRYSIEKVKERDKKQREQLNKSVDIQVYFATELPELSVFYQLAFEGFVIKPEEK